MKQFSIKNLFIFLFCFFVVERFCHWQTDGFRIGKIAATQVEASSPTTFLESHAFDQPYDYLDSGAQFYVFSSRDGRYVLKFFKTHHGLFATKSTKERRISRLFKSAKLAQSSLLLETGILLLHLEATDCFYSPLLLYDRLHILHSLDPNRTAFILQKRAQPAASYLQTQLNTGNVQAAKSSMEALLTLAEQTARKGIKNKDIKLIRNCGFIGDHPLILDIGSLSLIPAENREIRVRQKAIAQLRRWLLAHYPQHVELIP